VTAQALLQANTAFYEAFAQRDVERLCSLWARDAEIACIHPGWPAVHGRPAVLESWRSIFGGNPPEIAVTDARAYVYGETGFVICTELLPGGTLVATNVFVLEAGEWRLVHHQAGPAPDIELPEPTGPLH
jgi:ketosteroid isomerase-like protein